MAKYLLFCSFESSLLSSSYFLLTVIAPTVSSFVKKDSF
jgi:hypothetical protein